MSDYAQLMEEPPGGPNHGRRTLAEPYSQDGATTAQRNGLPLGGDEAQAVEFMLSGGWTVVHAKDGTRAGVSAHRGVLHPEEHVDGESLQDAVERELGFTYEQVRSVYRQGPLGATQRELRGAIDARVLALSRAGANVALLGRALGFPVKDNGNCRAMENALARARAEEVT